LFEVKKNFKEDLNASQLLNISDEGFYSATNRVSGVELNAIEENEFRPINLSAEVRKAFEKNAENIGFDNPLDAADDVLSDLRDQMMDVSLEEATFPMFENPFVTQTQSNPVTGPNTLNLPGVDQQIMSQSAAANQFSNLTMTQKIRLLFPNG